MKTMRAISVILMLTLAVGPALASACTVACVLPISQAQTATLQEQMSDMGMSQDKAMHAGMEHCQQALAKADASDQHADQDLHQQSSDQHPSDQHQPGKSCNMSGCHFVQITPGTSAIQHFFVDVLTLTLPRSNVFGASADLYPPIKPPA